MRKILVSGALVTATLSQRHEPEDFYQTREGLYVWPDFRDLVVAHACPSDAGAKFVVGVGKLGRDASDWDIEGVLSPEHLRVAQHLFDETTVCGLVAALLAQQWNGECGPLDATGKENLFYTMPCLARVSRVADAARAEWAISAWRRVGFHWEAGSRIFFPARASP